LQVDVHSQGSGGWRIRGLIHRSPLSYEMVGPTPARAGAFGPERDPDPGPGPGPDSGRGPDPDPDRKEGPT
jgi:hypothetical protein